MQKSPHDVPEELYELIKTIETTARDVIPWVADGEPGAAFLRLDRIIHATAKAGRVIHDADAVFEAEHQAAETVLKLTDDDN